MVLLREDFWKYLFVMCHALYAPMRLLHLANQKVAAIDKLYYYVLQTDRMLPFWLNDAEQHAVYLMTDEMEQAFEGEDDTVNVNGNNVDEVGSSDDNNDDDEDSSTAVDEDAEEEEDDDSDEQAESL